MNTKNWFPTLLGAGIIASGLALSSCEDEFTEADAIAAQDSTLTALKRLENENAVALDELDHEQAMAFQMYQDSLERIGPVVGYSVTVVAGGSSNTSARTEGENFAEGATVTLVQGGVERTATTNAGGVALFNDLRIGEAVVTVEAADHTTVTFTTSLGQPGSDIAEDNINTVVPVLPLTVEAGATEVSGVAYAELDLTNDAPEFAEGAIVQATIDVDQIENKYSTNFDASAWDKGEIQSITYTGLRQTATVGADGRYSLIIPNGNGSDGLGIQANIEFLPYEAEQTYVVEQGDSLAVVTKTVIFESTDTSNDDDHLDYNLPGVYVEVSAPVNNAQGFELEAEPVRSSLAASRIVLDSRGTGYAQFDEFTFAADADGEIAKIVVDAVDAEGRITAWSLDNDEDSDFINATYDSKPELTDNSATGSGASFVHNYETTYEIFVKSEGSGYWDVPTVNVTTEYYDNGVLVKNVTDETNDIEDDIDVVNGKIKAQNSDNSVAFTLSSATMPTFTIVAPEVRKAYIDPEEINVNSEGKITSISLGGDSDEGEGYTSQPTLTFKTVGENMGSGVSAIAIISNGEISSIEIANPGSGYMQDINDWTYDVTAPAGQSSNKTFKPASSNPNWDFNFGTGVVKK